MKKTLLFLSILAVVFACQTKENQEEAKTPEIEYSVFGDSTMVATGAITKAEMLEKYQSMEDGDSIEVKFETKINEVCQTKGCWMNLELADGKEAFVKFKDYAFFVPKNAAERKTIVEGKAFKKVTPVEELKHYAQDAGKSQEEIDAITEPKEEFSFMASGVLIES